MIKEKMDYESPATQIVFVKIGGIMCQSPGQNQSVDDPLNFGGIGGWE